MLWFLVRCDHTKHALFPLSLSPYKIWSVSSLVVTAQNMVCFLSRCHDERRSRWGAGWSANAKRRIVFDKEPADDDSVFGVMLTSSTLFCSEVVSAEKVWVKHSDFFTACRPVGTLFIAGHVAGCIRDKHIKRPQPLPAFQPLLFICARRYHISIYLSYLCTTTLKLCLCFFYWCQRSM